MQYLSQVEVFVLDEADRMLDMGFIHDIRRVINKLPKNVKTYCSQRRFLTKSNNWRINYSITL